MKHIIRIAFICAIVIIVIVLLVLNQNGLGFHNTKTGDEIDTSNGSFTCPYNSESTKNNAKKPIPLPEAIKHLNNVHQPLKDSSYSMEQAFGVNGAKSQLITEAEYKNRPRTSTDTVEDYLPKQALADIDTDDLRYGNPDVDGYSLCDVNPADDDEYYDPKLMNGKFKPHFNPLILTTSDEIELVGATPEPVCVMKDGLCHTAVRRPINTSATRRPMNTVAFNNNIHNDMDPIQSIIRGTDNPLPGPFSGRYKKCKK